MSEVLAEEVDGITGSCISVLTGPNLAKEVVQGFPAASTIACTDEKTAERLQEIFQAPTFRCYRNSDVVGCELGGAFKNVIAIAAGIADGLGFGDNTKATVMTRGLAELARFSVKFGGQPLDVPGTGRSRGSHRDVRQSPVTQSHGRHRAGEGPQDRRDHRIHEHGRGGGQEL